MKKKLLFLCFLLCSILTFSQSFISIYTGKTISRFIYRDANGEGLKDLEFSTGNQFYLSAGKIINDRLNLLIAIGNKEIRSEAIIANKLMSWQFSYADAQVGIGYFFLKQYIFKPYIRAGGYLGYMYKGRQTYGDETFNLLKKNEEEIKAVDFGVYGSIGFEHELTNKSNLFMDIQLAQGLNQIEWRSNGKEQMFNFYGSVSVGIRIFFPENFKPIF